MLESQLNSFFCNIDSGEAREISVTKNEFQHWIGLCPKIQNFCFVNFRNIKPFEIPRSF